MWQCVDILLQHVLLLPQQVPWTGQPRHTTGLVLLGFYGDTWLCYELDYGPRYEQDYGQRHA